MDVCYSVDVESSVDMVDVCTQLMEAGGECGFYKCDAVCAHGVHCSRQQWMSGIVRMCSAA
jgi:hypothetical protein